ncbi:MAG: ferritin [candidate division KSB1 bacterium]|nr:ferritin [candidate division KSB1 bacterium]
MVSKKMEEALNRQVNREMYSAYLYLSMAAFSEHIGLKGFAHWFEAQAKEEMGHAMRFYRYVFDQGAKVTLEAIEKPPADFGSAQAMFEKTLEHEKAVTKMITDLMELAVAEKDHATQVFLHWFISEQVEEEAHAAEILGKLKFVGEHPNGLFMIDRELGARQ